MDWSDLTRELDEWAREQRVATLWWRDDDAVSVTPALERALAISRQHDAPIHLSVIPGRMSPDFGERLVDDPQVMVLQHGFAHAEGELYGDRDPAAVRAELVLGRQILQRAFDGRFLPVLVPPWNLIRPEFIPVVLEAGLPALSADGARAAAFVDGVEIVNTHSGPLSWANGIGRFAGTSAALETVLVHLRARRTGAAEIDEPTGFCTHHLINEDDTWQFMDRLLAETRGHRAARWVSLRSVLRGAP